MLGKIMDTKYQKAITIPKDSGILWYSGYSFQIKKGANHV
jgi:hypothetical protein